MKNISILFPESEFTSGQLQRLSFAGQVSFVGSGRENDLDELVRISKGADVIAFPADRIDKKASQWLKTILEKAPSIKAVALDTTQADCIDQAYSKEHGIAVTTVLDYSTESVAEHVIALLLSCAKRILLNDRRTYRRKYQPEQGIDLRGKTLGIINVDKTAERVATLAKAFGMRVYLYSEVPIRMQGMERRSLNEVLNRSDMITLHLPDTEENKKFLDKKRISRLKDQAIVVNLAGRSLVDEKEIGHALLAGQISQYVFEAESMKHSSLENVETAIMLKPFSKQTVDSQLMKLEWVAKNVAGLAAGKPYNPVSL